MFVDKWDTLVVQLVCGVLEQKLQSNQSNSYIFRHFTHMHYNDVIKTIKSVVLE